MSMTFLPKQPGLRAALVCLALLAAGTILPSSADAQTSSPRHRPGHVYLMRGLLNVFSLGMDELAAKLENAGVSAEAVSYTSWSSIGDTMVVGTGRSNVHLASIADRIVKDLKAAGMTGIAVEGLRQGDWVVIDTGSVLVHIFRPEVRAFYNIEKMWSA